MLVTQFIITTLIAILVTIPIVLLIPHARKSPMFDRVLWLATWALAFLGEWSAPNYFGIDSPLNQWSVEQIPLISTTIGAIVGALSINIILWLMDRFSPPVIEEAAMSEPVSDQTQVDANPPESIENKSE